MDKKMVLMAGLAVLAFFVAHSVKAAPVKTTTGAPVSDTAKLLGALSNSQVTLANGAVLDTGNGVIFDPISGNYSNVFTGATIYQGI